MKKSTWTDRHDDLLVASAPDKRPPTETDLAEAWTRIEARMTVGKPSPARRRWRVTAGVAVGTVVLGSSGIAAADLFSARTGVGPSDREDAALGGPGERLDPAAPDFDAVIAEEVADIPFPSESSRKFAIADQVHDARFAVPGSERVSTGALRAWVADAAVCAWSNQWAAATTANDDAARAEAISAISTAPSWPAVMAIDPSPYSDPETVDEIDRDGNVTGTMEIRDESQFNYLAPLGRAVQGTDLAAVASILATNNGYCRTELVPDLPAANPMYVGR